MNILGLSSGFHDSAAALVVDGRVVAAVEQERLSRRKHDAGFPAEAADVCLAIADIPASEIDLVVCHEKPLEVVNRHLSTRIRSGPASLGPLLWSTPRAVIEQLGIGHRIARWFKDRGAAPPAVHYVDHHLSHAAAAFYPSPYRSAAVLTVDGVGEWATSAWGYGHALRLQLERELRFADSVGLLYSAFTTYCGFRANSGEGELMGLAPFGEPIHADRILSDIVRLHDDGSVTLDQRYFRYLRGRRLTSGRFHRAFGGPPRPLGSVPTAREADIAASVQFVLEEILLAMARSVHDATASQALCLAGGVALNCVANGRLLREGPFRDVWVQPAAGDAGSALGAALWAWHETLGQPRRASGHDDPPGCRGDGMSGAFLGPSFDRSEVHAWLAAEGVAHEVVRERSRLTAEVADRLARGALVGWFQGRMEFGPRALGHRSILADARSATVQSKLNETVKERATFRPFAPAALADRAGEWFSMDAPSPYMTFTFPVAPSRWVDASAPANGESLEDRVAQVRSEIPAVTHVDRSARVQTVDPASNPELAELLIAFEERTGCPVLLNTSFNARDEPIVCTPDDALRTFRRIGLDLLVLEDCLIERERGCA
jgi:carbamoyltransferase